MNDTALTSEAPPGAGVSALGRGGKLPLGLTGRRAIRLIGLVVVLASVLVASGSFLILTGTTNVSPSPEVWTGIWIANGILVLMVIALVLTEASLLIGARWRRQA